MNQSQRKLTTPTSRQTALEGEHISQARKWLTLRELRANIIKREAEQRRDTAKAMNAVHVTDFVVSDFASAATKGRRSKNVRVYLDRPEATRVNVRKLYTLVQAGEISLDAFLECISTDEKAVEETFGETILTRVKETYRKGLDLIAEEL